jgi:glycosyltransferase involved in cell wall biosynthesis
MMRMLAISPAMDFGGAEIHMVAVARAAEEAGWQVTFGFPRCPQTETMIKIVRGELGAAYVEVDLSDEPKRRISSQAGATLRLAASVRPDVMLVVLPWHDRGLGCIIGAALAGIPAAVVFQLAPYPVGTARWGPLLRWAKRRRQRWIAVSDQNRDALAATFRVRRSRIQVIPNGIDPVPQPAPDLRSEVRAELRRELALPDHARLVLTVARLTEQKGHRDLLGAAASIRGGRGDVVFVWAGEGELRAELERDLVACGLSDGVLLLGERRDVGRLLLASDLFVLPSHAEGLPFALLEAMAQGVPVLSSNAGGSAEVVRDGIDGLIYDRGDVDQLIARLSWALNHPAEMEQMADSARERVREFSRERMLRETLTALQEVGRRAGR